MLGMGSVTVERNDVHVAPQIMAEVMGFLMQNGVAKPCAERQKALHEFLRHSVGCNPAMVENVAQVIEWRLNALNAIVKSGQVALWVVRLNNDQVAMSAPLIEAASAVPLSHDEIPSFDIDAFRDHLLAHTECAGSA